MAASSRSSSPAPMRRRRSANSSLTLEFTGQNQGTLGQRIRLRVVGALFRIGALRHERQEPFDKGLMVVRRLSLGALEPLVNLPPACVDGVLNPFLFVAGQDWLDGRVLRACLD